MIKTKLVATVGPACDHDATLGEMIDAGVNVLRLNFSHGTLETHAASVARIRRVASEREAIVAVMGDLCGPKIRLGPIAGGRCELAVGQRVAFRRGTFDGTPERLSSSYPALVDDVEVGQRVLIDDGNVRLRVTERRPDELACVCEVGGAISDRKGINLPDSHVSSPALTDKDRSDLEWAIRNDLDLIALSFVRKPEDLSELRRILVAHGSRMRVVSKIEKPEAVAELNAIVAESDVVLVARGDLGVEMDVSRVPLIQKEIALLCWRTGKPVIVATQMLQSMVDSPVPTRAEVSDVANAILDRADAVMLSAETSVGKYPLEAVRMIRRIAEHTESFGACYADELGANQATTVPVATAVVRGANSIARELGVRLVAVWTETGETPRLLSKHRLGQPIVALAADERVCRQMALLYGVVPIAAAQSREMRENLAYLDKLLLDRHLANANDRVVVAADTRPDLPGETDALFIHVVGTAGR